MAVSYDQLAGYLDDEGLVYSRDEASIDVVFAMNNFVNQQDGGHSLHVLVEISDDGSAVGFRCPWLYDLRTAVSQAAVCELLASINFQTRSFRWEVDRRDGEVRGTIIAPVGGTTLAKDSFHRLLSLMPRTIDFWHPVIQRTITTGKLPPPPPPVDPRLEQAVEDAGGLEGLREIFRRFGPQAD